MSDYKDTRTRNERRYVYAALLLFLLGFGAFLLQYRIGIDAQFHIDGQSGTWSMCLARFCVATAYPAKRPLFIICSTKMRANVGAAKAIYILLFVPALFVGLLVAAIMTIPYCLQCAMKIRRIQMDNGGVYLRWQRISLLALGVIDILILVAYLILV